MKSLFQKIRSSIDLKNVDSSWYKAKDVSWFNLIFGSAAYGAPFEQLKFWLRFIAIVLSGVIIFGLLILGILFII